MTVGVISAIPEEYMQLKWDSTPRTETIINKIFQFGTINGISVIAAESGIGKVNAAMTTSLLLGHFGCDSVVFSGVAGGLNPKFAIGDVIIANELIQYDYGSLMKGKFYVSLPGCFPSLVESDLDVAYKMSDTMQNEIYNVLGDRISFGRILTGDTYLACSATRDNLRKRFSADAIEMEGAAIAQVCCNWHKPFVIVRVLSDLAGNDSPIDFDTFVDDSSKKAAEIVYELIPLLHNYS